jgi:hypothetical protein
MLGRKVARKVAAKVPDNLIAFETKNAPRKLLLQHVLLGEH